MAVVEFK